MTKLSRELIYRTLDTLGSDHSKRAYHSQLKRFADWLGTRPLTAEQAARYAADLFARGLSASTVNQNLAAIRKLAGVMGLDLAVPGARQLGVRQGQWLTLAQAQQLLDLPDAATIYGRRDRAILAVMLGAGLRRAEVAGLDWSHLAQRENRWVILDLVGKGNRVRTVPLPAFAMDAIRAWRLAASGPVFCRIRRGVPNNQALTPQAIRDLVHRYGQQLGVPLAPHDLRRTFSKLSRQAGAPLEQIQLALGHANIQTTQRYLGSEQDLREGPGDRIRLR